MLEHDRRCVAAPMWAERRRAKVACMLTDVYADRSAQDPLTIASAA